MNKLVTAQSLLFLTAIQIGILMGILFDMIRIFRRILKHPNFFVQIEDMLYWVVCGFTGFYMLYICNYAEIRPFIFIGMILGGVLYFLAFSSWFMKLAFAVIDYLKRLIARAVCLILRPIRKLLWLLGWPLRWIKKKCRWVKALLKMRYRCYKRVKYEQQMDKKVDRYLKNGKT